ncbi:N-acetyltransferase [Levilactobacillus suantsaii]|uniref:N-acetyltransferase n=1 Tax=Levilactobacillus suantsaii TaxID=2292255 RepID=A0A4Q0VL23_9LACO|nr:N-acetyltransferase [Levilactobacillus suantsaii]QMU07592.1 N-acetyltransferase [Levilactobacillus suantsaii]RXI79582.1 N-acetyltransferase [Levilactobacillus suantsaii]
MLLKYRSDYQKIAMGIMSLLPAFKDWDRLQQELTWYQGGDDRTLYLWKDQYDDFAGVVGTELQANYIIVRLVGLMPDKQSTTNEWQMLDQLATATPKQRLMGTLATSQIIAKWEFQHGQNHLDRPATDSSQ